MLAHNILHLICMKWRNRKTKAVGNRKSKKQVKFYECIIIFNTKRTQGCGSKAAIALNTYLQIYQLASNVLFVKGFNVLVLSKESFGASGKNVFK